MLRDETERALAIYPDTRFVMLNRTDPHHYGRLLTAYWEDPDDDLLICEQDILPQPSDIELMRTCPEPYCGAPFAWKTDVGVALGFTRFRREIMLRYPSVMAEASKRATWSQLDVTLQRSILVKRFGEQPHVHPTVTHLNSAKALMEGADPTPLASLPAW
jgi:hypothetical protein